METTCMSRKSGFIYSDVFQSYKFAEDHPFNPQRLRMTKHLLDTLGFLDPSQLYAPTIATQDELTLVHDPSYIEAVIEAGYSSTLLEIPEALHAYGLGTDDTPIFKDMHEATAWIAGGTRTAIDLVLNGTVDHACNISGGLHHAHRAQASGFCVYNDIAVAIAYAQKKSSIKIAYIDTDAHHGVGVQWLFYDDPDVMTISFHESGKYLFPGSGDVTERGEGAGFGYSLNIPLEPFTEDDSWIESMRSILIPALEAFQPDLIISQHGC